MDNNINLIAFGTFGNPNGFRQTFFIGNKELSEKVKTFDLNTNAIKLLPKTKIYAIRKENINGINSISYSIYNFAKEQNSDRSGTFIGSSILFTNVIAEESVSINLLNDFNENLINKNVERDIIKVIHSNDLSVSKPQDFDKTTQNLKKIESVNFNQFSNKVLVVYSEIKYEKLIKLFSNSLDLLNLYDTIYFTDNNEIAEFVYKKGMYKLVQNNGFEEEIISIQNERKQKIENSISDFSYEKQKVNEDKISVINDLKLQIENNEKLHLENEKYLKESKSNVEKIEGFYSQFSRQIDDYINQLKSGRKIEQVKDLYNENKRIFVNSVKEVKQPNFISKIQKSKSNSNLHIESQTTDLNNQLIDYSKQNLDSRFEKSKFDLFKFLTLVFSFLWVLTLIYFLWFKNYNEHQRDNDTQIQNFDFNPKLE